MFMKTKTVAFGSFLAGTAIGAPPITRDTLIMLAPPEMRGQRSQAPEGCAIASLSYDQSSQCGVSVQDFETAFDLYDIFVVEDFDTSQDARLGEFRSVGFGTGDLFQTQDVGVRIFTNDGSGLPGADSYTGSLALSSIEGAGFYDGAEFITDFEQQCLAAGSYYIVWAVRLDFVDGRSRSFVQPGSHDAGGGEPNNAWWWTPGEFAGFRFAEIHDCVTGERTGVNFVLCGTFASCSCSNPDCPADLDGDGDTDADDFFAYLDLFVNDDPCADIDQDGDADADDFFAYLDLFVQGCD